MEPTTLGYDEARRNLKQRANGRWSEVAADFSGWVWPEVRPTFTLSSSDTIFTIGSCFARNVEEHLARLGCKVPMLSLDLPPHEWRGAANSAMNKFNPPAFPQVIEWAGEIYDRERKVTWEDCAPYALECGGDAFFDMDMGATPPVSRARFVERRQHIFDIFSTVFTADCLMMTPGIIEAWRDKQTGLYTHEGPAHKSMLAHASRFELDILSYAQCEVALLRAIDAVRARNPGIKIVVTTSPVPLSATFSGQDVRIANTYSKSVLRAVCGALSLQRPNVDYFPSFESVTLSHPDGVWQEDRIHVSYTFVGRIVERLMGVYFVDVDAAGRLLQRAVTDVAGGADQEAARALREALEVRPDFPPAELLLADVLTSLGQVDEAVARFEGLRLKRPEDAEIQILHARALLHKGSAFRDEAHALIEQVCTLPDLTIAQFRRANRLTMFASPEMRERIARAALERFPLHASVYQTLGETLAEQARAEEAIDVWSAGAKLHKPPPEMLTKLAQLLLAQGRPEEAAGYWRELKAAWPAHPDLPELAALL